MKTNKQYNEQILDICKNTLAVSRSCKLKSKKYNYLKQYILENTKFLDMFNISLISRAWFVLNNVNKPFKCLTCGKILDNQNIDFDSGSHKRFCCPHCECINQEVQNTLKQTNIKKYGCEWTFQSENNIEKSKQTMIKKYGVEYAQQNKDIKNKSYETMLEKYGVKNALQCKEFNSKNIKTRRQTEYNKFLHDKYVQPLFSINEYFKYGNDHMYNWKCLKCNSIIYSTKNSSWLKQGCNDSPVRCEKCYPYDTAISYSEIDIARYLSEISQYKILNKKSENRKIIPPLELDIYIPEKKLAIEYDGLYWHSDNSGKNKLYHLNKTELCENQGIQLIHIFENEWQFKQDIVKSRLKNLLGIYGKTVFARKCQIKEINSRTSNDFQDKNHLQGAVNCKVNLGLFFQDELISLMTFSKPRFDKKHEWELVRFCNKLGYHIPGAAGKLLKYFELNYKPKSLVSYADRRWSQGKLYAALGFNLNHISPPNYWYWKNPKELESRVKYQKYNLHKLLENFDENLSESENMINNGYHRIYDCGNYIFEKLY